MRASLRAGPCVWSPGTEHSVASAGWSTGGSLCRRPLDAIQSSGVDVSQVLGYVGLGRLLSVLSKCDLVGHVISFAEPSWFYSWISSLKEESWKQGSSPEPRSWTFTDRVGFVRERRRKVSCAKENGHIWVSRFNMKCWKWKTHQHC